MAFREVSVVEVKEILRLWLQGRGMRQIARLAAVDRKTVRRYVDAAEAAGCDRSGGTGQLCDELVGAVIVGARPARAAGHGSTWELLQAQHAFLRERLDEDLTLTKVAELLTRRTGVVVPYATLHRYAASEFGFGRRRVTVRVADGEPGQEAQADFGKMGLIADGDRQRVCHALIVTACYSRHSFVWMTFSQTLGAVIDGLEAAWAFFGGVFAVLIPDNMSPIVAKADATDPRITDGFTDYAQSRGFVVDPARVRSPQDKPRVERTVPYVRGSFFRGERFIDLSDAQARAERWCATTAGLRIHGTTQRRPAEVFAAEEAPLLLPAPAARYDVPIFASPKVHRDCHVEVARALYSVPHTLIGQRVEVRADQVLVRIIHRGEVIATHPRQAPGGRSTDQAHYPAERSVYAMRDVEHLRRLAACHGASIGIYADQLLSHPLPWTTMRQVYRLLGLVRRYGADRVETACGRALGLDVVDVTRVARMLERALEGSPEQDRLPGVVVPLRFARDPGTFRTRRSR